MVPSALLLIVLGALCFAVFGYVNFVLQPRWFPGPTAGRGAHMWLGVVETFLFLIGAILVTMGATIIGTGLGYGGG